MKKAVCFLCTVALILMAAAMPAAAANDFVGEWVCVAVDLGDGTMRTEYEGTAVGELMRLNLKGDGTLVLTSMGMPIPGTWTQDETGVAAVIDGQPVRFDFKDEKLVNSDSGFTAYLERAAATTQPGGLLSLLKGSKYTGRWVAIAVDEGDGIRKEEFQGLKVRDMLSFQFNRDGTMEFNSMGIISAGSWTEIEGGIRVEVDDEPLDMLLQDDLLVADADGVIMYFQRAENGVVTDAASTQAPADVADFAGTWDAVRYETMGYEFDIKMMFPEGSVLTLRDDGTGEASLSTYLEQITWVESEGVPVISGSYVLSSPAWNAEKGELSFSYGTDTVKVIYKRSQAPLATPVPVTQTAAPTPEITQAPTEIHLQTAEPAQTPAVSGAGDTSVVNAHLFSAAFVGEGWAENTGWRTDREDYSFVRMDLKDENNTDIASISITASIEEVRNYRDKLKSLTESAGENGKDGLEAITIGGIAFQGAVYEQWDWTIAEYAARVVDAKATLTIKIEQPGKIVGLEDILGSIAFTLPALNPPNVDPPMPEDGEPYSPAPVPQMIADRQITAGWLKTDQSIVVDSIFDNQIALSGNRLYVLAGKALYAYTLQDSLLVPDASFGSGKMLLDDTYEYLAIGKDGILYVCQGFFDILAIKDGAVLKTNELSGYLAMHPSGEWGISHWVNADPKLLRAGQDGELTEEPWVLSSLSDNAARKGRFSAITCITITQDRIYVAGSDAGMDGAQRVAVYDLNGAELFTFGAQDWTADDAFGSVTGIAETPGGILVLDGNYRAMKLFSRDGTFIGSLDADDLLGTDYPWLSALAVDGDDVLIGAVQGRKDNSADELLVYRVTGF